MRRPDPAPKRTVRQPNGPQPARPGSHELADARPTTNLASHQSRDPLVDDHARERRPRRCRQETPSRAPYHREVSSQLCLLCVHGHPDDETFHAGGALARYAAEGVRILVVTGTRGELGQIVDPALNTPANRADVGALRMAELDRALARLGQIEHRWLGYRDSGMLGSGENENRESFCQADVGEAVGRLVRIIREVKPQVLITHNEVGGDGHPDHVRAALVTRLAFDRAGDPDAYANQLFGPDAVVTWVPDKLYESVVQYGRLEKLRRLVRDGGVVRAVPLLLRAARAWQPSHERERSRVAATQGVTTARVDVRPWLAARDRALREFRSQMAPDNVLFAFTPGQRARITPTEDFSLRSARLSPQAPEDDLFAGLRVPSAP
ncbi:MAG: PIG-L family deacetylase [Chloroflexi bacterium]|nr:PIG-L family deacetylase [Chloroflexota bacterium]